MPPDGENVGGSFYQEANAPPLTHERRLLIWAIGQKSILVENPKIGAYIVHLYEKQSARDTYFAQN